MSKQRYFIPGTYFNPEAATRNLVREYQCIDNGFNDPNSLQCLPSIFHGLNTNLNNIKTSLRLNPDRCVELLTSIIGNDEDFDREVANFAFNSSAITDEEQKSVLEGLTKNVKVLRGFLKEDNRYVQIPHSINTEDRKKLLEIASQSCIRTISGMISYLAALKEGQQKLAASTGSSILDRIKKEKEAKESSLNQISK